jgi:hypothetical protein
MYLLDYGLMVQLPTGQVRLLGTPILLSRGYRCAVSHGVKRQRREADHQPPSSAEVKNDGCVPPRPHIFSWTDE